MLPNCSKHIFLGSLVLISCVQPLYAQSGGIEIFAGETLFDQGLRLSESYLHDYRASVREGSDGAHNSNGRRFEEHRFVTGVDYGALPNLTFSALVPLVYREDRTRTTSGTVRRRAHGLGDIAALAKYRIYKRDWEQSTFNLSLIGGLELPTGRTGQRDSSSRLPPYLQVGSGSWDPLTAVAATVSIGRFRSDAHAFYKLNAEGAQDYQEGDFFAVEWDLKYRFLHMEYPGPTAGAKIGIQWRHEQRDRQDGSHVDNTGSSQLVLRPGLSLHPTPNTDISLGFDFPVYQHVRGRQLVRDVRTFFALGIRF